MKSYINNKGKKVVIAEMPSSYLLNSYSHYQKRLVEITKKLKGVGQQSDYKKLLQEQVNSLWAEIAKRNLVPMPVDNRAK